MDNTKKDRPPCDNNNTKRNPECLFRRNLIHSLEKTNVFLYQWAIVKIPALTSQAFLRFNSFFINASSLPV
jgi:hypothetical protein